MTLSASQAAASECFLCIVHHFDSMHQIGSMDSSELDPCYSHYWSSVPPPAGPLMDVPRTASRVWTLQLTFKTCSNEKFFSSFIHSQIKASSWVLKSGAIPGPLTSENRCELSGCMVDQGVVFDAHSYGLVNSEHRPIYLRSRCSCAEPDKVVAGVGSGSFASFVSSTVWCIVLCKHTLVAQLLKANVFENRGDRGRFSWRRCQRLCEGHPQISHSSGPQPCRSHRSRFTKFLFSCSTFLSWPVLQVEQTLSDL
ncbi:hypothetical protein BC939DRAFT_446373 [Gamsiella multidivaricata]|uniref:uncharacterized protein n=1 Tax=Gamsiella multidivaricata TaxID=101098 RepID=UPI00221EC04A|nr:uncharacterized protein BC939DRAFT_446373 [Gamsiella multidivaricata]KAI7826973.1 hypothetical protein BC939DRAFT_446373 [Gamsiella multidivaricata]